MEESSKVLDLTREAEIQIVSNRHDKQMLYIKRGRLVEVETEEGWEWQYSEHSYNSITPASAERLQALLDIDKGDEGFRWSITSISMMHCIGGGPRRGEPDGETVITTYKYLDEGYEQVDYHLTVKPSYVSRFSESDLNDVQF